MEFYNLVENYKIGFWKSSKVFSTKALLKNRPLTGLQKNYKTFVSWALC